MEDAADLSRECSWQMSGNSCNLGSVDLRLPSVPFAEELVYFNRLVSSMYVLLMEK